MAMDTRNPDFYKVPYIHYYEKDVQWNTANRRLLEANRVKSNTKKMMLRYKAILDKSFEVYKRLPDGSLEKLNAFVDLDDKFVQEIFETWAADTNQKISNSATYNSRLSNLQNAMTNMQEYGKAVFGVGRKGQTANENTWKKFFDSVESIIKIFGSVNNSNTWQNFKIAYRQAVEAKHVTPNLTLATQMLIKDATIVKNLKSGSDVLEKVLNTIASWPNYFITKKDIKKSLTSSITNVTSAKIGEFVAAAEANAFMKIDKDVKDIWRNTLKGKKSAELTGKNQVTYQSGVKATRKADIVKAVGAEVTLTGQGNDNGDYVLIGKMGINVKWYKEAVGGKNPGSIKENISVESTKIFLSYVRQCFKAASGNYAILNTLAFNSIKSNNQVQQQNFRLMYQSVAAKMLEEFIAGHWAGGEDAGIAMLMVNGKFYPIISILAAYVDYIENIDLATLLNQHSKDGKLIVRVNNSQYLYNANQKGWKYKKGETIQNPNKELAWVRARKIGSIKDGMTVTFKLNKNILLSLAEQLKVKPLSSKK